jgi:hypothetical protein
LLTWFLADQPERYENSAAVQMVKLGAAQLERC